MENLIITLDVILYGKIEYLPVIIPSYVYNNRLYQKYDIIMDLDVILPNNNIENHPVIVPKYRDVIVIQNNNKRKLEVDTMDLWKDLSVDKELFSGVQTKENTMNLWKDLSVDKELFSGEHSSKENTMNLSKRSRDKEHKDNDIMTQIDNFILDVSMKYDVPLVSPIIEDKTFEIPNKRRTNSIDNLIDYINNLSNNEIDNLYIMLNEKIYPEFEKNKILDNLTYINHNLFNYEIYWTIKNIYIIKYPIYENDTKEMINNIQYKSKILLWFCENILIWINYCIKNNIKKEDQYKYVTIDIKRHHKFFHKDENTIKYWKQYRLNIPMDYIYNRLPSNIEIVFIDCNNFYFYWYKI